jgi:hypothetical protein
LKLSDASTSKHKHLTAETHIHPYSNAYNITWLKIHVTLPDGVLVSTQACGSLLRLEKRQLQLRNLRSSFIVDPLADRWPRPKTTDPGANRMLSNDRALEVKIKSGDIGIGIVQRAFLFQRDVEIIDTLVVWI